MPNKALITHKLAELQSYLQELRDLLQHETHDILHTPTLIHSLERLFQLIVDGSVSVNTHIIADSGLTIPDENRSTFTVLAEHNILPRDFALRIAPSVGLRNLIVHKYGDVRLAEMVELVRNEIHDYETYVTHIQKYISSL
jgi:uncharacterized protein YutE (UPF0331/DUF86 family)